MPNEVLLIYDLGVSDDDLRTLNLFCNNTKCLVITYDLTQFPSYVNGEQHMHAYRPLIIKDSLLRSKSILFAENNIRIRGNIKAVNDIFQYNTINGVLGWATRQAVSSRTHPKMFEYFETDADSFFFLPMVSMDTVLFVDSKILNEQILLPWIKCTLTLECIHPIGKFK